MAGLNFYIINILNFVPQAPFRKHLGSRQAAGMLQATQNLEVDFSKVKNHGNCPFVRFSQLFAPVYKGLAGQAGGPKLKICRSIFQK